MAMGKLINLKKKEFLKLHEANIALMTLDKHNMNKRKKLKNNLSQDHRYKNPKQNIGKENIYTYLFSYKIKSMI